MSNNESRSLWAELREQDPELYNVLLHGTQEERKADKVKNLDDHIYVAENLANSLRPFIEWASLVISSVEPRNGPEHTIMGPLQSKETGQIFGVSFQHGIDLLEAFELYQTYKVQEDGDN